MNGTVDADIVEEELQEKKPDPPTNNEDGIGHDIEAGASVQTSDAPNYTLSGVSIATAASSQLDDEQDPARNIVYLRVESVGKTEARILLFVVWLLAGFITFLAIAILVSQKKAQDLPTHYKDSSYYVSGTVIGGIDLGVLGILAWHYVTRILNTKLKKKQWTARRKALAFDAFVLLTLAIIDTIAWLVGHVLLVSKPRCDMPVSLVNTIGAMSILRYTSLSLILLWILVMITSMRVSPAALLPTTTIDPDYMLRLDQPWKQQLRDHVGKIAVWAVLELSVVLAFALAFVPRVLAPDENTNCGTDQEVCSGDGSVLAKFIISTVLVALASVLFLFSLKAALRDHRKLPYSHYRLTNVYLRIAKRHTTVLLFALFVGTVLIDAASQGACIGNVNVSVGAVTTNLALTLFAVGAALLYMPSNTNDVPAQALKQEFAWTEEQYDTVMHERNAKLLRKSRKGGQGKLLTRVLSGPLFNFMLQEDGASKREKVAKQPMFCVETAIRLFYWARYSYQYSEDDQKSPFFTKQMALGMFALEHFRHIHEPEKDSRVVMGWNKTTLVIAFRGTDSLTNAITDLKFWSTVLQANPLIAVTHRMRVHSGFAEAWTCNDFDKQVLSQAAQIINSTDTISDMRVLITGHSLGGALATLAALSLKEAHPLVDLQVCTLGSPRVGNRAFARYYNAVLPNTFALTNKEDPVARIPKFTYVRVGSRVTMNCNTGDIIVNPTFFEQSVLTTSTGVVKEHMTRSYGLALALLIKSQFFISKRLPGGEQGAVALVQTMDVGAALLVDNMDLESLRDLDVMPKNKVEKSKTGVLDSSVTLKEARDK